METHLSKKNVEVRTVPLPVARTLVEQWHYAKGGANTATFRHGLFRVGEDDCIGVAWWIPPTKGAAISMFPEGDWRRVVALSRLVVHPDLPTNSASFLIGASVRLIRQDGRFDCLVTYADDWRGHTGAIYKATNWQYMGRTEPQATWIKDGRMVSRKAGGHTRTKAEMEALGCTMIGRFFKHRFRIVIRQP